jgi:hypothetical protein
VVVVRLALLFDTIKYGGNFLWCMKLEELMVGKYSKIAGTCSKLAGTSFTIGKKKFKLKFLGGKGPESE